MHLISDKNPEPIQMKNRNCCYSIILTSMKIIQSVCTLSLVKNLFAFFTSFERTFAPSVTYKTTGDEGEPLFITPLLQDGMHVKAQNLSRVNPSIGNVTSYSGFFTVNSDCESNLFFWFFTAQSSNWEELPLLLWLQGGPGVSSMYGLFLENGPFEIAKEGFRTRKYSWNKNINIIYIDQPVGAGFSFTGKNCFPENQTAVGEDLYHAIVQFHQLFPNFQKNKFFISGQSYAGHYIPALGHTIHKYNPTAEVKINLSSMIIGNGWSDPETQMNYGPLLYQLGLIDDSQRQEYQARYHQFLQEWKANDWEKAYETYEYIREELFVKHVGMVNIYNFVPESAHSHFPHEFFNNDDHRRALHVGSLEFRPFSDQVLDKLSYDRIQSVKMWVEKLLEDYQMVYYNGQLDIICAYSMTTSFLRSLHWSGQALYRNANRSKWCADQEQAGYLKGQHNLYDVLVRGAGHAVPADQPRWAFELINSIVSGPPNDPFHMLNKCSWN